MLGARNATPLVLARDKASLAIDRVPHGVVARMAEDRDRTLATARSNDWNGRVPPDRNNNQPQNGKGTRRTSCSRSTPRLRSPAEKRARPPPERLWCSCPPKASG